MNKYINNDVDTQLQYVASRQKKIAILLKKCRLIKQADNEKDKKLMVTQLSIIQRQAYIYSIFYFNPDFYIRLFIKQISLLHILLSCIVKVIKPLHDMSKANTNHFAAYYPYYKKKPKITGFTYKSFFL